MSLSQKTLVRLSTVALLSLTLAFSGFATIADAGEPADWKAPRRASRKKNPQKATAKSIAAGKKTFVKECVSCHGAKGKGDGAAAKDFKVKPRDLSSARLAKQSDGALFWKITNGRAPMTTFKTLLTEKKRWEVINYIRTLGPNKSSAKIKAKKAAAKKAVAKRKAAKEKAAAKKLADEEAAASELADKELADKEAADKEAGDKEAADEEAADEEADGKETASRKTCKERRAAKKTPASDSESTDD